MNVTTKLLKIFTVFTLIVGLYSTCFSQNKNRIFGFGHNSYLPENQYMIYHTNFISSMEPGNQAHITDANYYDVFLLDTAFVYSVADNPLRYQYVYSNSGFRLTTTVETLQGNEWVYLAREICTYDDLGNMLTSMWQSWDIDEWVNSSYVISTYSEHNNLLTLIRQEWEVDTWVNTNKSTNTFDPSGVMLLFNIQHVWENGEWEYYSTETYSYDNDQNLTNLITQLWNETYWYNDRQYNYTYDQYNNLASSVTLHWEDVTWKNLNRGTYLYNTNNQRTSLITELWENDLWLYNYRFSYSYDALDFLESTTTEIWENNSWVNFDNIEFVYGAFGNVETETTEVWSNNSWENSMMLQYVYDDFGNAILGNYYTWDGNIWTQVVDGLIYMNYNTLQSVDYFTGYNVEASFKLVTVGINDNTNYYNDASCNPNPAFDSFSLSFELNQNKENINIYLFDTTGRMVKSIHEGFLHKGNHSINVDTHGMQSGTYFVNIVDSGMSKVIKIQIIK